MIRVAIYDDHPMPRETLSALLSHEEDMTCVGIFENAHHVIEDLQRCEPDIVLMDIQMPNVDGIQATKIFKWMPDRKLSLRSSVIGGVLTAALFVAGKYLISLYIGKTAVGSAYGAAGSLVVLLVWVYYSSLIVFLGAEVSYALFYHEKKVVEEEPAPPKRRKKVYVGIGVGPRTT